MDRTDRDKAPRVVGLLVWAAWLGVLVVFTYGLVAPQMPGAGWIPRELRFAVAKGGHVAGYALLAILTAWLPVPRLVRLPLLAMLVLHAGGTEYAQTFVSGRFGSWRDVGFDLIGVILGTALTWRRWWR